MADSSKLEKDETKCRNWFQIESFFSLNLLFVYFTDRRSSQCYQHNTAQESLMIVIVTLGSQHGFLRFDVFTHVRQTIISFS